MNTLAKLLVFFSMACVGSFAAERPNVVILMADDLGWADVGFHGSRIQTPNIDALAENGVQLDRLYMPLNTTGSRGAMMTGRYPHRFGAHISVLRPWHTHGIPLEERFLSQMMQDAGYRTAIAGKWQMGVARRAYWPQARGFDLAYGHLSGAVGYYDHIHEGTTNLLDWYDQDTIPLKEEGYTTDLVGDRAVRIISEHEFSNQPLFLYVAFNTPHLPLEAPAEEIALYSDVEDSERRLVCAMITRMDHQIGKIMQALRGRQELDDTLILFASDNGGSKHGGCNVPFRGRKGTSYEGGMRVTAVMHWTNGLKGSRICRKPLHAVDLYPTLMGLVGGSHTNGLPLDGLDVWSAIADQQPLPERDLLLNVMDATGRGAVISGPWKLILSWPKRAPDGLPVGDGSLHAELFNLEDDPFERNNLAVQHPDVVADLWSRLKAHGPEVGDARPYHAKEPQGWIPPDDWSGVPE